MPGVIDDPRLHLQALRRQALRLTGSGADADDLVQEALARALTYVKDGRAVENWGAYLRTVLRRVRADQLAKRAREGVHVDIDDLAQQLAHPPDQHDRIRLAEAGAALARLPGGQRDVIVLVLVAGHSYQVAAMRLGVPTGTVMSRLFRGKATLRQMLGEAAPA
jgi:RNA polymerase sigma-70 factor, ECF subfamily